LSFERESKLKELHERAFSGTNLVELEIPAKSGVPHERTWLDVRKISVSPEGEYFQTEDSFLVHRRCENVLLRYLGSEAEVVIRKDVEVIHEYCFFEHRFLQNVMFEPGSKLREIGDYAVSKTGLTRITIPANVESIGESSFSKCQSLGEVEFEAGSKLQRIRKNAFKSSGIERITIPANVEVIEETCFSGCQILREVTFEREPKLREIHKNAFYGTALAKLEIPAKCEVLHEGALIDVTDVSVSPENAFFKVEDSFLVDQRLNVLLRYCGSAAEVIVEKEIEGLGESCFFRNKTIRKLSFETGSQLVWIGPNAFAESSLIEMRIPSTIEFVHQFAFTESSIEKITFYKGNRIPPKEADCWRELENKWGILTTRGWNIKAARCLHGVVFEGAESIPEGFHRDTFMGSSLLHLKIPDGFGLELNLPEGCHVEQVNAKEQASISDRFGQRIR
jgi:hypothetical protein